MSIEEIISEINNLKNKLYEYDTHIQTEIDVLQNELRHSDYNDLVGCCFISFDGYYHYINKIQINTSYITAITVCLKLDESKSFIFCNNSVTLNFDLSNITFINKDIFLTQYNKVQANIRKNLIDII